MDNLRQSWESWLDTAVGGIRFGYDRRAVRAELCAHLEDKAADLQRIFPDMTAEEAEARALGEMGDAQELRSALAKIHRPWLGYLWRASQGALALLLLVMIIVGANTIIGGYGLGGWYSPGKDWQVDESRTVLLNPVEEEVNVEGGTITVPQALIWKAGEEKELRAVLRVEDLRFWRKSSRQLQLMSARDDLGRYYISTYEESRFDGQWQQGYAAVEQNGWGPFHQTYLLRVSGIDPEARWIELNYDCLGRSFSLRVDLTEEAEARAVGEMGDAEELRSALAKLHRPWLGYVWLCSKVLIGVLLVLLVGRSLYTDHYYSTGTGNQLWDWDDLPGLSEGCLTGLTGSLVNTYTGEEIYTPGSAPEQLFARSYGGRQDTEVNGQAVSLRRAALWQGDRGQELFVWLRVQDWRFWERASLDAAWFVVTDSLGNQYHVDRDRSDCVLSKSESGPFFEGWQLYLRRVDPEAEWVRVEYGLTEPSFSFTVDLERG